MAENLKEKGCRQKDRVEHEEYVGASRSFRRIWEERNRVQPKLLEKILSRENLNRAFKRVKKNKGAAGVDGMTIEETQAYLKEGSHAKELVERIRRGKYTPQPVRSVGIPKPDGGARKLGIPTVIDRTIQQAITQQLVPIYEPLFAEGSYGYRPGRSAKSAIRKVKEYAEQGYTYAVALDLSKYFDTLNHEILLQLLRKNVKDERVMQLIKRYLKSGIMEKGVVRERRRLTAGRESVAPASQHLSQRVRPRIREKGSPLHTVCGRHRPAREEQASRAANPGQEHSLSGGETETESQPREKQNGQRVRNEALQISRIHAGEKRKRRTCTSPPESVEEDESQTQRACVPEESAETADISGQDKSIYARLAELLRDSEHEESHRRIEPMAVPSRKDVYLEALEEAEDEDSESMQVGSPL